MVMCLHIMTSCDNPLQDCVKILLINKDTYKLLGIIITGVVNMSVKGFVH